MTAPNPVPSDLASHKDRATTYHAAWTELLGTGQLLFAGREDSAGRGHRASAASESPQYVASRRVLWH